MSIDRSQLSGSADRVDPRLRRRWIAATVWSALVAASVILGFASGAYSKLTVSYAVAGAIFGGLLGVIWAYIMLSPRKSWKQSGMPANRDTLLGVGTHTVSAIPWAFLMTYYIYDYYASEEPGPILAAALTFASGIGLASVVFDLWVASPKRFSDHEYEPTKLSDGGQLGLPHRGHGVAAWAGPIFCTTPLLLFSWFMVGVENANLSQGFAIGTALGALAIAYVAFSSRGSYSDRVDRHARRLQSDRSRLGPWLTGLSLVGFAGFIALVDAVGFCAGFFAVFVACNWGLLATFIDRWIVTPRKMDADPGLAFG